jgi:hypothetical protein
LFDLGGGNSVGPGDLSPKFGPTTNGLTNSLVGFVCHPIRTHRPSIG